MYATQAPRKPCFNKFEAAQQLPRIDEKNIKTGPIMNSNERLEVCLECKHTQSLSLARSW